MYIGFLNLEGKVHSMRVLWKNGLQECKGNFFAKLNWVGNVFSQVHKLSSGVAQGLRIMGPNPYPNRNPYPLKFTGGGLMSAMLDTQHMHTHEYQLYFTL